MSFHSESTTSVGANIDDVDDQVREAAAVDIMHAYTIQPGRYEASDVQTIFKAVWHYTWPEDVDVIETINRFQKEHRENIVIRGWSYLYSNGGSMEPAETYRFRYGVGLFASTLWPLTIPRPMDPDLLGFRVWWFETHANIIRLVLDTRIERGCAVIDFTEDLDAIAVAQLASHASFYGPNGWGGSSSGQAPSGRRGGS